MSEYVNGYKVVKRHAASTKIVALLLLLCAAIPVGSIFLPLFSATDPDGIFIPGGQPLTINAIQLVQAFLAKLGVINLTGTPDEWLLHFFSDTPGLDGFNQIASWMIFVAVGVMLVTAIISVVMVFVSLAWLLKAGHEHYTTPMSLSIVGGFFNIIYYGIGIFAMLSYGQIYSALPPSSEVTVDILYPVAFASAAFSLFIIMIIIFVVAFKDRYFIDDVHRLTEPKENTKVMMPNITVNVNSNGETVTANAKVGENTMQQQEPVAAPVQPAPRPLGSETLPNKLTAIGGHAFSNNHSLRTAVIPSNITSLGAGAFANCSKLQMVTIPTSVKEIGYNCFFNCASLERINYLGTKAEWSQIKRGSNWLTKAKTNIVICSDGKIIVNPMK